MSAADFPICWRKSRSGKHVCDSALGSKILNVGRLDDGLLLHMPWSKKEDGKDLKEFPDLVKTSKRVIVNFPTDF